MKDIKMKWIIPAIVGFIFTIIFLIFDGNNDLGTWCFLVFIWLTIMNIFLILHYVKQTRSNGSEILDYSLFLVPVIAFVIVIRIMIKDLDINWNQYLSIHIAIFAVSVFIQILLIESRKYIVKQDDTIKQARRNKDELTIIWTKISKRVEDNTDLFKMAKEIEEEVKYADPIINDILKESDKQIYEKSITLFNEVENAEYSENDVIEEMKKLLERIKEQNHRNREMK